MPKIILFLSCVLSTALFAQATYDVMLSWDKHADPLVTKYTIYRMIGNHPAGADPIWSSDNPDSTSYIDRGLLENKLYYYWATATTEEGIESAFSEPAWIHEGTTSIEETPLPLEFNLYQNYPNPFNPSTQIRFDLPRTSHVILTIYDITGRQIMKVVDERMQPGQHTLTVEGSLLASGIYFYALRTETFSSVKKMILIE